MREPDHLVGRVRHRGLDERLAWESPLRSYLAGKDETALAYAPELTERKVAIKPPSVDRPRTLLIMPPLTLSEGAVKRVIPPLGLAYIAATLESAKYPVQVLDCVAEGTSCEEFIGDGTWRLGLPASEICRRIAVEKPDVIGISVLYSSDLPRLFEVAEVAKKILPRSKIVAGGLHASIYPQELLSGIHTGGGSPVDFVIRGEGEYRLLAFLANLRDGVLNLGADGLCGVHDGVIFTNPQRTTIADLDRVAFPFHPSLPMHKYFAYNVPFSPFPRGKRVAQILTSRGCPVGCTFCTSTNFQKAYRTRSVANVIEEIRLLKKQFSIDEIQFADDNLTFDRHRSLELFEELRAEGLPWCTPNGIMVNTLNEQLIDAMISSGLYQITLSIDGATRRTLRERHRKPVNLERVPAIAEYLASKDILVHATLVIGAPGETEDEIREGFDYLMSLPLTSVGVFIAQAIPGSELYEVAMAQGRITSEEARRINTARASRRISDIGQNRLEQLAASFIYEFNQLAYRRRPDEWMRKYQGHLSRLRRICIGRPAPNTDGIIAVEAMQSMD